MALIAGQQQPAGVAVVALETFHLFLELLPEMRALVVETENAEAVVNGDHLHLRILRTVSREFAALVDLSFKKLCDRVFTSPITNAPLVLYKDAERAYFAHPVFRNYPIPHRYFHLFCPCSSPCPTPPHRYFYLFIWCSQQVRKWLVVAVSLFDIGLFGQYVEDEEEEEEEAWSPCITATFDGVVSEETGISLSPTFVVAGRRTAPDYVLQLEQCNQLSTFPVAKYKPRDEDSVQQGLLHMIGYPGDVKRYKASKSAVFSWAQIYDPAATGAKWRVSATPPSDDDGHCHYHSFALCPRESEDDPSGVVLTMDGRDLSEHPHGIYLHANGGFEVSNAERMDVDALYLAFGRYRDDDAVANLLHAYEQSPAVDETYTEGTDVPVPCAMAFGHLHDDDGLHFAFGFHKVALTGHKENEVLTKYTGKLFRIQAQLERDPAHVYHHQLLNAGIAAYDFVRTINGNLVLYV